MLAIKYILLGIIQGLTEFLPVSSSAHLLIFRDFFQIQEKRILLEIVLHLGSLCALVVFLFKDIKKLLNLKIFSFILLATGITAIIVVCGQQFFTAMFSSAKKVAFPLFITGVVLVISRRFAEGGRSFSNLGVIDAFWLGLVQGLAVIPGISRSGVTIAILLWRNVEREAAFKFSFLASILAIFGALLFKVRDFPQLTFPDFSYMLLGFLAAFFSGLLALRILLAVVRKAQLYLFGFYCLVLALGIWIFYLLK